MLIRGLPSAGGFVPKSDFGHAVPKIGHAVSKIGHAVSKILRKKIKMRNQEKFS